MLRSLIRGAVAGAAGTTALNAVTYLDMAVRGRPASSSPNTSVERLSERFGIPVPGSGEQRDNRVSGLGALMGLWTGVAVGAAYGAARGLGWHPSVRTAALVTTGVAMAGSAAPMAALGVSDPRSWSVSDWVSDVLPHLAFGLVTAASYALGPPRRRH
ncbi:hypothetical protein [Goodfellowiella coeruleoviolacea]|uniref:DUF1440 domain-containing protein n=1 Tax=Goodfellowiella coeruleoviolacea TaxID=334858 RepID=A0AAE3GE08_9PSEU|nr:hypothetical protein [Goodfellowiella coeruleoviolacea]MCP2166486.1 hypothetical protein [Goodfellowiella coeruleoviolacea]